MQSKLGSLVPSAFGQCRGFLTTASLDQNRTHWKQMEKYTVRPMGMKKTGGRDRTGRAFTLRSFMFQMVLCFHGNSFIVLPKHICSVIKAHLIYEVIYEHENNEALPHRSLVVLFLIFYSLCVAQERFRHTASVEAINKDTG